MSQAIMMRGRASGADPTRPAFSLPAPTPSTDLLAKADEAYGGDGSDYASPVPRRLRVLRAVAVAAVTAWAAVAALGIGSIESATRTVGQDAAPSVVAAEKVRALLADANGNFANVLLAKDGDDGPFMSAYRQDVRDAETALAAAGRNVTYGDEEIGPIVTLMRGIAEYADLVGQARAAGAGGNRSALADGRAADTLMHFTLLPAAATLERVNHDHLTEAYEAHRGRIALLLGFSGLLALAALAAIGALHLYLGRRTRRLVEPFAAGALVVLSLASGWVMLSAVRSESSLRVAKLDAFESFAALATAQAYANDANAAESFWLLSRDDATARTAYAEAFAARGRRLLAIPTDKAAVASQAGERIPGLIGDAMANVTFAGEREAVQDTLRAWIAYVDIDARVRALDAGGKAADAVALGMGFKEGQSNWAFARFDQALERSVEINRQAFDAAIGRSARLVGKHLFALIALAWLLACAGAWTAAARRLRAYEF